MNNPWTSYGLFNNNEDYDEDIQTADTLRPEELKKLIENNSKDPKNDGINCKFCKDWFHMAEPNQPDGYFICRDCKSRPWRNSPINSE